MTGSGAGPVTPAAAAAAARQRAAEAVEPGERARRLLEAAERTWEAAGGEAARPLLAQALRAAGAARSRPLRALALAEQARLDLASRDPAVLAAAQSALDRAARLAGAADPPLRARIEHYRGLLFAHRGDPAPAVACLRRAYALADGDPDQRARILNSWGLQLEAWGEPEEARRLLERSLELKLQREDLYGAAATYGTLAFLHARQGDHAAAREALARDLGLAERLGATELLPGLHARLAAALLGLGRLGGAEREIERALELAEAVPGVPAARAAGFAWRERSRLLRRQGRPVEAAAAARDRALAAFEALRDPYGAALARLAWAEAELDRWEGGDGEVAERARAALEPARAVFARLGAVHETAAALLVEARRLRAGGDPPRAAALLRDRALPLVERLARGAGDLRGEILERLAEAEPEAADRRLEVLAGLRRSETAAADAAGTERPATVVAARVGDPEAARRLAAGAVGLGGVVAWIPPDRGVVWFGGEDGAGQAASLRRLLGRGIPSSVAEGPVRVDLPWPGPAQLSGPAVDRALRGLPARAGGSGRRSGRR